MDEGTFGRLKTRLDPGGLLYAQDLDLGRRAAASELWGFEDGLKNLAALWRYTLLRSSLRSKADQYPDEALQMLLTLGRKMQVAGLAELVTDPVRKVEILLLIANHASAHSAQESEVAQSFLIAEEVAFSIEDRTQEGRIQKARALKALAIALAQTQHWDQAEKTAFSIEGNLDDLQFKHSKAEALRALAIALAHDGQWQRAQTISAAIMSGSSKDEVLSVLISSFAKAQHQEQAESIWQKIQSLFLPEVNSPSVAFPDGVTDGESLLLGDCKRESYFKKAMALDTQVIELAHVHRWEQAYKIASSIQDNFQKIKTLSKLACFLYEANFLDKAKSLCDEVEAIMQPIEIDRGEIRALNSLAVALTEMQPRELVRQVVTSMQNDYHQSEGVASLSASLVRTQCWEEARQAATSISDDKLKDEALIFLTTALAEAHYWEEALQVTTLISNKLKDGTLTYHFKESPLVFLTTALAEAHHWEKAREVAFSIQGYDRSKALASLVAARANAGYWDEAKQLAESIQDDSYRTEAFASLTIASVRACLQEQAEIFWIKAQEAMSRIRYYGDGHYHHAKGSALVSLVKALVDAKGWQQARVVALFIPYDEYQTGALGFLVEGLVDAKDWQQAREVALSMQDDQIQGDQHKDFVLGSIAIALADDSQWGQVGEIINLIQHYHPLSRVLCDLAILSAERQLWEQAEDFLLDALKMPAFWEDDGSNRDWETYDNERANAWMSDENYHAGWWTFDNDIEPDFRIAKVLEFTAICAKARCWNLAEKIIPSLQDPCKKVEALSLLAIASSRNYYWERAREIATSIPDNRECEKVVALSTLASAFADVQRWEQAESYWEEARKMALSIKYDWSKAQALDAIITTYSRHKRYEDILRIVQSVWLQAETREEALKFFPFVLRLLPAKPGLGAELYEAFKWVDAYGRS